MAPSRGRKSLILWVILRKFPRTLVPNPKPLRFRYTLTGGTPRHRRVLR
jgi:hypothetical protein